MHPDSDAVQRARSRGCRIRRNNRGMGYDDRTTSPPLADRGSRTVGERHHRVGAEHQLVELPRVGRLVAELRVLEVVSGIHDGPAHRVRGVDHVREVARCEGLGAEVDVQHLSCRAVRADPRRVEHRRRPPHTRRRAGHSGIRQQHDPWRGGDSLDVGMTGRCRGDRDDARCRVRNLSEDRGRREGCHGGSAPLARQIPTVPGLLRR